VRIDHNTRFWTKNNYANRWLGLRLDWIGAGIVGFTALACVLAVKVGGGADNLDPGIIGLVLAYTTMLTGLLNWGVRQFSDAEQAFVAVERTRELCLCPQESTADPLDNVPTGWPTAGEVKLKGVSCRYRAELSPVLKKVDILIPSQQKVGVCGRTGSGKTTLAKLLFRLIEAEEGSITIDGLDIALISLSDLRSGLTMIPQDPVLFSGPLRYSLDPADRYSEDELWNALDTVGMKKFVEGEGGLQMEIYNSGENLSAGQRQLVCMARALLEKPRVLVMDESTSNMDNETDKCIQSMIKEKFFDCTVLTIAHRIDTILYCDRVLVLDEGVVAEYDSPAVLSKKPGSLFASLLSEYRDGKRD